MIVWNCVFLFTLQLFISSIRCRYMDIQNPSNETHYIKVGHCSVEAFYKKEQACTRQFFRTILDSNGRVHDCSCKFTKMQSCKLIALDNCLKNSEHQIFSTFQSRIIIHNFQALTGSEESWCINGGLKFTNHILEGVMCHQIYAYAARECTIQYEEAFQSATNYSQLCRKYDEAKLCVLRNLVSHCSFPVDALHSVMTSMIEAYLVFNPYCPSPLNKTTSYRQLYTDSCPPNANADILFLLDASSSTTSEAHGSMKRLVSDLAQQIEDRTSGIRLGVAQFHQTIFDSIDMDRFSNQESFRQHLNKLKISNSTTRRRLTGQVLTRLANQSFNMGENSSIIRPFHTPIVIVLTTGSSEDNTTQAVQFLSQKRVHVVRFGPTLVDKRRDYDVTYHVNDTRSYHAYLQQVINEICRADRTYRSSRPPIHRIQEGPIYVQSSSPLASTRRHIFSRFSYTQAPLFWVPRALQFANFTTWHNEQLSGGRNQVNLYEGGYENMENNNEEDYEELDYNNELPNFQTSLLSRLSLEEGFTPPRRFN